MMNLEDLVQTLLDNPDVVRVPSNGKHTRFYTEPLESEQWDYTHHLLDLHDAGCHYSTLTITQLSTGGSTQVQLTSNEVDALTSILLTWRYAQEKQAHEQAEREPGESLAFDDDGDGFP